MVEKKNKGLILLALGSMLIAGVISYVVVYSIFNDSKKESVSKSAEVEKSNDEETGKKNTLPTTGMFSCDYFSLSIENSLQFKKNKSEYDSLSLYSDLNDLYIFGYAYNKEYIDFEADVQEDYNYYIDHDDAIEITDLLAEKIVGLEAYTFNYTYYNNNNEKYTNHVVYINGKNGVYILYFEAPISVFDYYMTDFMRILSTFTEIE